MLKKLIVISSLSFLAACSSNPSNDYETDAVAQQNESENGSTQIVGKEIIPINLFEKNLRLEVSSLFVTVNSNDDPALARSTVSFEIKYQEPKDEQAQQETATDESTPDNGQVAAAPSGAYTKVIANQRIAPLDVKDFSKDCDDAICTITQTVSFEIPTQSLEEAKEDGFAFYLEKEDSETAQEKSLGTLIPSSYLIALFAKYPPIKAA